MKIILIGLISLGAFATIAPASANVRQEIIQCDQDPGRHSVQVCTSLALLKKLNRIQRLIKEKDDGDDGGVDNFCRCRKSVYSSSDSDYYLEKYISSTGTYRQLLAFNSNDPGPGDKADCEDAMEQAFECRIQE